MGYRVYYKAFCDIPGCEGKGNDEGVPLSSPSSASVRAFGYVSRQRTPLKNGDVLQPQSWRPGALLHAPVVPSGWRYENAGVYGLWICPKHKIEVTIDGQSIKDVLEDRETYYKLRGQP